LFIEISDILALTVQVNSPVYGRLGDKTVGQQDIWTKDV